MDFLRVESRGWSTGWQGGAGPLGEDAGRAIKDRGWGDPAG